MKAAIIKIGNSRGIRLPKPVIEQCGFEEEVEIEVHDHDLVIRSVNASRKGWDQAFSQMSDRGDDDLLQHEACAGSSWDEEEWEW